MAQQTLERVSRSWTTRRDEKRRRMQLIQPWMKGPILPKERIIEALETLIVSGDRIVLEGDNQKQADFLSRSLVKVDPKKLHDISVGKYSFGDLERQIDDLDELVAVDDAFAPDGLEIGERISAMTSLIAELPSVTARSEPSPPKLDTVARSDWQRHR